MSTPRALRRPAPDTGRVQQKRRTRRLLLATAAHLIAAGRTPTVVEVADAADVSRRTAYRYFPTQEQMLTEAALEGLRPIMEAALAGAPTGEGGGDMDARVDTLVRSMLRLAIDHEPLLRTMVRLTISRPRGAEPRRGVRRLEWIEDALAPARRALGRARHARLAAALAVTAGIESLVVLRDLCGLSPAQAEDVSRWMARTLLRESLAEARHRPRHD